jgi:hypothetical protein
MRFKWKNDFIPQAACFEILERGETGADEFLTFDEDQANLARASGLPVWIGKE